MRTLPIALLALALPSFAAAQDAVELEDGPRVEMEQTTNTGAEAAPDLDPVEAGSERDVEDRSVTAEEAAAAQDPRSREFWYIVLAVVVGGIILAVLL